MSPQRRDLDGVGVRVVRAALRTPAPLDLTPDRVVAALAELRPELIVGFADLGFDEATASATLADLARKVEAYGTETDVDWLLGIARADVVALGRLQFERVEEPTGRPVHIPEVGPLDPVGVDDSFARARAVFGPGTLTCHSWLLDPLLLDGLDPDTNLASFARRFTVEVVERDEEGDRAVAKFVFRRPVDDVLDPTVVIPRTRLEHLVVDHLRSGGHWSQPHGILPA